MGQAAAGQADLADHAAVRAGQQPPQDLPLGQRREYGRVGRVVEQPQQPGYGVEQVEAGFAGGDRGRVGRRAGPPPGREFQQQRGDGGRAQGQPQGQRRDPRAGVDEVAGEVQFGGDHEEIPRPVLEHLVAEQQALASLGHDDQALDQGLALVPWSPLKNGFLSGKYRRGHQVTDSVRTEHVGGPSEDEYAVIDAVAAVADELGTTSAAVSLAWLRAREGTVMPIVGARLVDHLRDNLAGLEVPLTPAHLRTLDDVSAPVLGYPAAMHGALRAMLQFAGTTVDGEASAVYPPLVQSNVRY